jgi:acetoin utilization protein AcuB
LRASATSERTERTDTQRFRPPSRQKRRSSGDGTWSNEGFRRRPAEYRIVSVATERQAAATENWMRVRDLMSSRVVSVELDDRLHAVKDIFDHARFHHLLVVDQGRLVGVISDRDLLKALSPNIGTSRETTKDTATLDKRVHQIMSRAPVTLPPQAAVREAIDVFNSHRISCIPIVATDGKPVGVLSWRDIFKALDSAPPNTLGE